MFEKKGSIETNYDSIFGNEILRSLQRIEELDDETNKANRELEFGLLKFSSDFSSAKRDLRMMKTELGMIKEKITDIKQRFTSIVNELRTTATTEDMERLSKRVDNFDFETFVSREDFMELILKK
jgi:hypothetical protein